MSEALYWTLRMRRLSRGSCYMVADAVTLVIGPAQTAHSNMGTQRKRSDFV